MGPIFANFENTQVGSTYIVLGHNQMGLTFASLRNTQVGPTYTTFGNNQMCSTYVVLGNNRKSIFMRFFFKNVCSWKKSEKKSIWYPWKVFSTIVFLRVLHENSDFKVFFKNKPMKQVLLLPFQKKKYFLIVYFIAIKMPQKIGMSWISTILKMGSTI